MMRRASLVPFAAAAALLCGCAALSRSAPEPAPPPGFLPADGGGSPRALVIGVLVAGWHSGLILPARELAPLRAFLPRDLRGRYVSFGWGNRRFYMSPHPTSADAMAALFSSPSVVLIQAAPTAQELVPPGATLRWLCADREEVWRMDVYLRDALHRLGGKPVRLGPGPHADSAFFASRERYDALHTCNTWTAAALAFAGLPVRAGYVIFSGQIERLAGKLPGCPRDPTASGRSSVHAGVP